jgi:hypothetical protein
MAAAFPCEEKYYLHIAVVVGVAFLLILLCLVAAYTNRGSAWLPAELGERNALFVELYFWAALGATIATYKFFANDKERNELEALKEKPDPQELRYPNLLDVFLYAYRILFSGVLGVIGAVVLLAGLGYFDVPTDSVTTKLRLFLVIVCFLVGMHQNEFLSALARLNHSVLSKLRVGEPGSGQ